MQDWAWLIIGLLGSALLIVLLALWRSAIARARAEADRDAARQRGDDLAISLHGLETEHARLRQELAASDSRAVEAREMLAGLEQDNHSSRERMLELQRERAGLQDLLASEQQKAADTQARLAEMRQELASEKRHAEEKLALMDAAKQALTDQFKALAADTLKANSQSFGQAQQERLEALLNPFRDRLRAFEEQVRSNYESEGKERATLKQELKQLAELNAQMSQDAQNLSNALVGQSKTRGDWGEIILERLLQHAGLRQGQEYHTQRTHTAENGNRQQPDVIIDLPEDKHLVIDAKLNLIAWLQCSEAADAAQQASARKQLVAGMRAHMRQLGNKNYQQLYGLHTVDFVLMFIPIEAAFSEALNHDHTLYQDALNQNIVLASPTTLLATMRTIAAIWRYDRQEQNAFRIAELAGRMYDQLVRYVASFEDVGERLRQAQTSYDEAHRRLTSGRGNLIGRAEKVHAMGAQAAKKLGKDLRELATGDDAEEV